MKLSFSLILFCVLLLAASSCTKEQENVVGQTGKILLDKTSSPNRLDVIRTIISLEDKEYTVVLEDDQSMKSSFVMPISSKSIHQNKQSDGYIVELDDEPLFLTKKDMEDQGKNKVEIKDALSQRRQSISTKQETIKKEIRNIDPSIKTEYTFLRVFNGFSISDSKNIDQIKKIRGIKQIQPNHVVKATLMDSVPLIHAPEVWQLTDSEGNTLTGRNQIISIIDTGIDYTHADLGGCFGTGCKVIGGYDFVNMDPDPMDDHGHGTHVAATAAGNGALYGVAPDAFLYAYKVLDASGSGSEAAIIAGIEASMDPNGDLDFSDSAQVISMSLGGGGTPDSPFSVAVDTAVANGAVVVVAAGNAGPTQQTIGCPGCARDALTVGAVDKSLVMADFSSRGPVVWEGGELVKPDVVAPGVSICAARWDLAWPDHVCLDDRHTAISGTSMATPHVAGAAALIRQAHPDWSPQDVKNIIKVTATDLGYDENTQGAGFLNVLDAVSLFRIVEVRPFSVGFDIIPNQQIIQKNQMFTIKNLDGVPHDFTFTSELPVNGFEVYIYTDHAPENLGPGEETSVNLEIIINNDVVPSNTYYIVYFVVTTQDTVVKVPIWIRIESRITITPEKLDFDVNNPENTQWQAALQFELQNKREDVQTEVSLDVECCSIKDMNGDNLGTVNFEEVPGFNIFLDETILNISPGLSLPNVIHIETSNAYLANGVYEGKLNINNPLSHTAVPFMFIKYNKLFIVYDDILLFSNDLPPFNWLVKDGELIEQRNFPSGNIAFLLDDSGIYDFYSFIQGPEGIIRFLMKENIMIGGFTEVHINEDDAPNFMRINYVDEYGAPLSINPELCRASFIILSENNEFGVAGDAPCPTDHTFMKTAGSQKPFFFHILFNMLKEDGSKVYAFEEQLDGFYSDVVFTNTPQDLISRRITFSPYEPPTQPTLKQTLDMGGMIYASIWYPLILQNRNELIGVFKRSEPHNKKFWLSTGLYDYSTTITLKESPFLLHHDNFLEFWNLKPYQGPVLLYQSQEPLVTVGNDFEFWSGRVRGFDENSLSFDSRNDILRYFMTQSFTKEQHEDTPYQLYRDGNIVDNAILYGVEPFTGWIYQQIPLYGYGEYELAATNDYQIEGQTYSGHLRLFFNNEASLTPPYLNWLRVYSGGVLSDKIFQEKPLRIELSVGQEYPNIDEVKIILYYSAGSMQQYTLSEENDVYTLTVPAPVSSIDHIIVSVFDTTEHGLVYDFRLPWIKKPPGRDGQSPVIAKLPTEQRSPE